MKNGVTTIHELFSEIQIPYNKSIRMFWDFWEDYLEFSKPKLPVSPSKLFLNEKKRKHFMGNLKAMHEAFDEYSFDEISNYSCIGKNLPRGACDLITGTLMNFMAKKAYLEMKESITRLYRLMKFFIEESGLKDWYEFENKIIETKNAINTLGIICKEYKLAGYDNSREKIWEVMRAS